MQCLIKANIHRQNAEKYCNGRDNKGWLQHDEKCLNYKIKKYA